MTTDAEAVVPGRLPDLIIIGAAKSGTSSLATRLGQHPHIYLSPVKEPEFFSDDANWAHGFGWYCQHFAGAEDNQLCLEASTAYTRFPQFPDAARRLHDACPRARLIYLMRHPVDRAYSHYLHRRVKELYPGQPVDVCFEDHVEADPMCLDSSDYRLQLEQYLAYFPRDSLLLLFTHELEADEAGTLQRICEFAGIPYQSGYFPQRSGRQNVAAEFRESRVRVALTGRIKSIPVLGRLPYFFPRWLREVGYRLLRRLGAGRRHEAGLQPPAMRPETRSALLQRYAESNAWVSAITGADLSAWSR